MLVFRYSIFGKQTSTKVDLLKSRRYQFKMNCLIPKVKSKLQFYQLGFNPFLSSKPPKTKLHHYKQSVIVNQCFAEHRNTNTEL
jgi:hypothetical protein